RNVEGPEPGSGPSSGGGEALPQEQPVVPPQVSHFRQVPLRTRVKLPHVPQASPSYPFARASARSSAFPDLTPPGTERWVAENAALAPSRASTSRDPSGPPSFSSARRA